MTKRTSKLLLNYVLSLAFRPVLLIWIRIRPDSEIFRQAGCDLFDLDNWRILADVNHEVSEFLLAVTEAAVYKKFGIWFRSGMMESV
jgi:hypothetical protein